MSVLLRDTVVVGLGVEGAVAVVEAEEVPEGEAREDPVCNATLGEAEGQEERDAVELGVEVWVVQDDTDTVVVGVEEGLDEDAVDAVAVAVVVKKAVEVAEGVEL